jgi:uncharacterized protein YbjQ (UPF0145 family)
METQTLDHCPHCNAKLKTGILGSVTLYPEIAVKLINEYVNTPQSGYCTKCGSDLLSDAKSSRNREFQKIGNSLYNSLHIIPIITLQHPAGWDYSVIRMITAQSTMGTGVFTEFAASFSDMLGNQSKGYNDKIKVAENNCLLQLRIQALNLGANAVIGTDIDYSEMGGAKSMVMVCMSGTAISLKNMDILNEDFQENMKLLSEQNERIAYLKEFAVD